MGLMANVEYFYNKCNEVLNTNYTSSDWGEENTYRPINLEWLSITIPQVFKKIHDPKTRTTSNNFGCNLYLSTRFNYTSSKFAVPIEVVNSVVSYLANFNKPCDNDCACYRNLNCQCDCTTACATFCSGPATCSGRTVNPQQCECTCSNCNCNCTCPNCACECGSNSECVCDCDPYDCNCKQLMNCNIGSSTSKPANCVYHCGKCVCNCNCDSSGGGGDNGGSGSSETCVTVNNCKYSWSGSSNSWSTGVYGGVTVSGSTTSNTDVKPNTTGSVTIPVSMTSFTAYQNGVLLSACTLSKSSVEYKFNGQYIQSQGVSVSYGNAGQVILNSIPTKRSI